ncbi:hypothetical protein ACH41H_24730 [Streptomyces sp. NPDC020800]|uniref:hypothetical protein n=1 Tax=Streptomyces sp. NPDC020800 TaxID=3365092 RepID=UPI0037BC7A8C
MRELSPGACWLARLAGHSRPTVTRHPWVKGPLASIPIGGEWAVVRVPGAAADRARAYLAATEEPTGPVLSESHVRSFLVHPVLHDGRDIPGGILLTGARGERLRCPMPGEATGLSRFWAVPPDGSGALLDPWLLAGALRATWAPFPGQALAGSRPAHEQCLEERAGVGS